MLGGVLPARRRTAPTVPVPPLATYAGFALRGGRQGDVDHHGGGAAVRQPAEDKDLGPRIVPIVADEARTFGMANLFRQVGIYAPEGQLYEPEDAGSMLYYREARDGQLLEEGITEAGAISSWTAAATVLQRPRPVDAAVLHLLLDVRLPAGRRPDLGGGRPARARLPDRRHGGPHDARRRGPAAPGRVEPPAWRRPIPNCRAYDPAFAYEMAVIVDRGARAMMEEGEDAFYYLTAMNENYAQPSMPDDARDGIIKGLYRVLPSADGPAKIRLVGSGAILPEALAAAAMLQSEWKVACEVWSATSFSELAREARDVERTNRLSPLSPPVESHVVQCLGGKAPIVAASDYVRAYPQLIGSYIEAPYTVLGTDGFGRSDTRAALRSFFEVDRKQIVVAALSALAKLGQVAREQVAEAIASYELPTGVASPWSR